MTDTVTFTAPFDVHPWPDQPGWGFDPDDLYVELFWLPILGPTSTFAVRHLARRFTVEPSGFTLDPAVMGEALGIRDAAAVRALHRLCQFGFIRGDTDGSVQVRRRMPPLSHRQVTRLPGDLPAWHDAYTGEAVLS